MKGGPIDLVMGDNLQASNSSEGGLDQLPLNCLGTILSFLTPREVEIAAYVCRSFREASKWNFVWEKMLPPRYEQLAALDPAFDATRFRDLREFYFHLCQFSLFANSTKVCRISFCCLLSRSLSYFFSPPLLNLVVIVYLLIPSLSRD